MRTEANVHSAPEKNCTCGEVEEQQKLRCPLQQGLPLPPCLVLPREPVSAGKHQVVCKEHFSLKTVAAGKRNQLALELGSPYHLLLNVSKMPIRQSGKLRFGEDKVIFTTSR